jgi:hypothetical protein
MNSKPTKGVVRYNGSVDKKEDGKTFCIHCKNSFCSDRFYEHVFTHQSKILPCDECKETFRSPEMLKRHQIRNHQIIMKCYRCGYRGTISQFHRSHMEQCFKDFFNEENPITKHILSNNDYLL